MNRGIITGQLQTEGRNTACPSCGWEGYNYGEDYEYSCANQLCRVMTYVAD